MPDQGSADGPADFVLVRCPRCGVSNRIERAKMEGLRPVCGRCRTTLSAALRPVTVTDSTFAAVVERSPLPVLVDLWSQGCPPCRLLAPVLDELAGELAGRVRIAKLNVDENPLTTALFDVRSIPTLIVFKGGREIDRLVGARPKAEIAARLARL
jgi:thioredoxin 2